MARRTGQTATSAGAWPVITRELSAGTGELTGASIAAGPAAPYCVEIVPRFHEILQLRFCGDRRVLMSIRGGTFSDQRLTITMWCWEEGLDLGQDFRAAQAADLITVRQSRDRVVAFLMSKKSDYRAEGEVIGSEEGVPADSQD